VLPDLLISRRHARLEPTSYGYQVIDLGSSNRTFVNGLPVTTAPLQEGDLLTIGRARFTLRRGVLEAVVEEPTVGLSVEGVSYQLPDGRLLTDQVSLQVAGPRLVAVLGPSGAGKSTLLRLISGQLTPSQGCVRYHHMDVHQHPEARARIGMVPQHTVAHSRLTAREALDYAAELRLSGDVSPAERRGRVDRVLAELGLMPHANTRVDRLSGGQRRRLAIGFELLNRSSLLLLDEPTAGLDPALAFEVTRLLRRLADEGRQVLVTTHDTNHLDLCDLVVIMGTGGRLVYVGPPSGIAGHFGTDRWPEIFARVAAGPGHAAPVAKPTGWRRLTSRRPHRSRPHGRLSRGRLRRQISVVCRRQIKLLRADPGYLAFLALMPLALAGLALTVPGGDGLGPPRGLGGGEAMRLLVVLIVGATFTGTAASIRDLVAERAIFQYERAAGLSPEAYLVAKLCCFATIAAGQAVLLVTAVRLFRPGPATAVLLGFGTLEVIVAVAATAVACTVLGLLVSSLAGTTEQTTPPLVVIVMAQLVLCGGMIPVTGRAGLEQLSWLAPARWGYAAAAGTVDLRTIVVGAPDDRLWSPHPAMWLIALLMLCVLTAGFATLTLHRLRTADH